MCVNGFRMIQAHYIYCALYFNHYYIVICNEIIIQLTILQNQWEPWACFPATRQSHQGVMGDSNTEVCCLYPVYSLISFWLLSLQKTLLHKDAGNGRKLFSAFVVISGYSAMTLIQNVCYLPLTHRVLIWVCKQLIMVSVQSNSANDNLHLQPLPNASITASAPPQILRH